MWTPRVRTPAGFEGFYQDARTELLLQCFALTGDRRASQRAVRDAMVVARHHWRKVSRLEHPEDWVRPLAWTRAQRRSQAGWWSREPGIDADDRATLDALARLSGAQRRVLLLAALTAAPMESIAREAGVTRTIAERDLQAATAQFAVHRDVPTTQVQAQLELLHRSLDSVRWPRPSTVSREGAARRRIHTVVGAAVSVAVLVTVGSLVTESGGAAPALSTTGLTSGAASAGPAASRSASPAPEPDPLTSSALLANDQVTAAIPGTWAAAGTSGNTDGDGLVFTCQQGRYADPQGLGALVRTFTGTGPKGGALTAGQATEASADDAAAQQSFTTALDWYAGCVSPRLQLVSTSTVTGVGDQAALLLLRNWNDPATTQVVGVARTGRLVTTVVTTQPYAGPSAPDADLASRADLLGTAVTGLCALPDHGACTTTPAVAAAMPYPVGVQPGLLGEVDLPPVKGLAAPWVASDPAPATENAAATRCDNTRFTKITAPVTRTYLVPGAQGLSAEFGLSETGGTTAPVKARAFVRAIRSKLASCHDRDLGTTVTQITTRSSKSADLTVWRLDIEVSKKKTVRFLMGVVRTQGTVAQLTFIPSGSATIGNDTFTALAERAQQRLAFLTGG